MALWNYDPLADFCCQGRPYPWRGRWGYFEPEPLTRWADTSFVHSLLSHGILPRTPERREVVSDENKYQVTVNLGDFKSNEINVKLVDQCLEVCAEHDEKPDEYGHIFRRIKRRYILPLNVDFDKLKATLSDDGTLVVCAKKKEIEAGKERKIEIQKVSAESKPQSQISQQTGQAATCCGVQKETEKGTEKATGQGTEKGTEKATEKGAEKGTEKGTEKATEKGTEKGKEKGTEKGTGQETGKEKKSTSIPIGREIGSKN